MSATAVPVTRITPAPPQGAPLPPGPAAPIAWQTAAVLMRQRPWLERQRQRYGNLFTTRVIGFDRMVACADPALIKQVFTAPADVLHAGDTSPLKVVLGRYSLLGIDEDLHLEQRRLLLAPFKGERLKAYAGTIERIAAEQIDALPTDRATPVGGAMQTITLRVILETIFGATGRQLTELEQLIVPWTEIASRMVVMPRQLHSDLGARSPGGRLARLRGRIDAILDDLIAKAKADPQLEERSDILAMLVQARHENGDAMSNQEIRDQLVTMLGAGHETTAHQLSWAVERLARHPEVTARMIDEIDAGGKAYREAVIREVQRVRPVIYFAGRTVMKQEGYELAGYTLPRRTMIILPGVLTHADPGLFPEPEVFRPERFLDTKPATYEWIPFGGGIRRCIGATFAHLEMDIILRVLLERRSIAPTTAQGERSLFRGVAFAPADGGVATLPARTDARWAATGGGAGGNAAAGAASPGLSADTPAAAGCPAHAPSPGAGGDAPAANPSACPVDHTT